MSDKKDEKIWTVYALLSPKDKWYFGITCRDITIRWDGGCNYSQRGLKDDINKYGWSNFRHLVIGTDYTYYEAAALEKSLIEHQKGVEYNKSKGGEVCLIRYKKNKYARKCMCIETGETFNSLQEADRYYNLSQDMVGKVCRGEIKTARGKHFKFI